MANPPTAQTPPSKWVEYPVQRPSGGYVNGRFNPASGEIQAQIGGDWKTIANVPSGQAPGQLSAPTQIGLNEQYFHSGMGWALPSQQQVWTMRLAQQQQAAQGAAGAQGASTGTGIQAAPSYWGTAPQSSMGGAQGGVQGGAQTGVSGAQSAGGTSMATNVASQISPYSSLPAWQTWYGKNLGKQMMVNGQAVTIGQDISADDLLQAFRTNPSGLGWNVPASGPQQPAQPIGGPGQAQPESLALAQMAQIDPRSEALRQALGQSYLTNLGGGPPAPQPTLDLSRGAAAPNAADVQSYLNLYKQIDPQGFAQRQALAGQMGSYLNQAQQQAALGAKLDPGTIREVEQGTRQAQIARGNVYGTPQLVAETMARGTAGEQRLMQRQQLLGQALGQQQGYLTSGAGMGDVANNLYNQGFSRYLQGYGTQLQGWQAQQNARLQSQGAALGYLGSGQTPYQAGASYLNMAQQNAAQAAQGGPQYNPQALGQQYTGAGAPSFPQYGLDMSQLAGNWYNNINQANLQAYGLQQAYGQKGGGGSAMGAGIGALGGAASGALAGAAAGGIGAIPGAIIGGIGGAASGYFK